MPKRNNIKKNSIALFLSCFLSAFGQGELVPTPVAAAPATKKECENKFNINELVFKIEKIFPKKLKDCSADLTNSMAPVPPGFHGASKPKKPPKEFMMQCAIYGIEGLDANKYMESIEKFLQNILSAASTANGELDVANLSKAIDEMKIGELLDDIRKLAGEDECMVDEPYEPPVALINKDNHVVVGITLIFFSLVLAAVVPLLVACCTH
jgi:hypothetical protein